MAVFSPCSGAVCLRASTIMQVVRQSGRGRELIDRLVGRRRVLETRPWPTPTSQKRKYYLILFNNDHRVGLHGCHVALRLSSPLTAKGCIGLGWTRPGPRHAQKEACYIVVVVLRFGLSWCGFCVRGGWIVYAYVNREQPPARSGVRFETHRRFRFSSRQKGFNL